MIDLLSPLLALLIVCMGIGAMVVGPRKAFGYALRGLLLVAILGLGALYIGERLNYLIKHPPSSPWEILYLGLVATLVFVALIFVIMGFLFGKRTAQMFIANLVASLVADLVRFTARVVARAFMGLFRFFRWIPQWWGP